MKESAVHKSLPEDIRGRMVAANQAEYEGRWMELNWITEARAMEAESERASCLAEINRSVATLHQGTKLALGLLSPGCAACGQGGWSCLFINGKCNCRCFYCPTAQDDLSVPTTNRIAFRQPQEYAEYIRHFGFAGVSISGGEPLLTLERTVSYMNAVRRTAGDRLHLWLYTNGALLTPEIVAQLQDAGLNEMRFDISAREYDLGKLELAAGRIPCVTVEIPAIPEDRERVAELLPVLFDAGVNHLNLHQLRLTPHNFEQLKGRPYTFLHGEKVTVLESELMVLGLMRSALEKNVGLPINYCSYVYKHYYQGAAARKRGARHVMKDHEALTESGYIRAMAAVGEPAVLERQAAELDARGVESRLWNLSGNKTCLYFHPELWPLLDFTACELQLGYSEAVLSPHVSYRHAFKEIRLHPDKTAVVERQLRCPSLRLDPEGRFLFEDAVIRGSAEARTGAEKRNSGFGRFEFIPAGLPAYF
ncbi:MAG: radical SAM protein [Thermodesulfobacteriota bacterium]